MTRCSLPVRDDPRRWACGASTVPRLPALVLGLAAACGGADKKEKTTPDRADPAKIGDPLSTNDVGDLADPANPAGGRGRGAGGPGAGAAASPAGPGRAAPAGASGTSPGGATAAVAGRAGGPDLAATPTVTMPNYDPDPAAARSQVEQHLQRARAQLAAQTPDPETALREAKLALEIDAANVDAAAMVALAYYHKRLYDTAELVLDDLFKRDAAKQNASVYYVYGLVYDQTRRPEQAVLSYQKAVELDPRHASALTNLGVHQLQNTQYAQALQTFERLVNQFGKSDAVTLTSLGSAYRGHAADYPATSPEHGDHIRRAEAAYKRAQAASSGYGPASYNLGLLYLDNDPFPGLADTLLRLRTAKAYFDQYKNMPGVDMKLYDDRMKDVTRAIKRAEKQLGRGKGGPAPAPAKTGGSKR